MNLNHFADITIYGSVGTPQIFAWIKKFYNIAELDKNVPIS